MNRFWLVVPAAGAGKRFGAALPKQYLTLCGRTVFHVTLARLCAIGEFAGIRVAVASDDERAAAELPDDSRLSLVPGGAERADSVLSALRSLDGVANVDDWVLVHDVARPCVRLSDIRNMMQVLGTHPVGGVLGVRVRDTMKRTDGRDTIVATEPRDGLWHAYTPQMFRFGMLRDALAEALQKGLSVTDEASAIELSGGRPCMVEGHHDNLKITYPQDLALAGLILQAQESE